eukprot:360301-Chlamydomonas_euryale.AAC.4
MGKRECDREQASRIQEGAAARNKCDSFLAVAGRGTFEQAGRALRQACPHVCGAGRPPGGHICDPYANPCLHNCLTGLWHQISKSPFPPALEPPTPGSVAPMLTVSSLPPLNPQIWGS